MTIPPQPIQTELEYVAEIQSFISPDVLAKIQQRAQRLAIVTMPVTGPVATVPTGGKTIPLVKRLHATPQPLSDLFILSCYV